MKTSWKRLEDIFARRREGVFQTSWRCLEDIFKTSWRRFEDVFKKSWRRLKDVLKMIVQDVLKTSWKRLEDVLARCLEDVLKMSWKRLEDILKTYGQDEYIGLDQDVFWRRKAKANIFVLIKTSSRRRHQDECLLGDTFSILTEWIERFCSFILFFQEIFTLTVKYLNYRFQFCLQNCPGTYSLSFLTYYVCKTFGLLISSCLMIIRTMAKENYSSDSVLFQ